MKGGLAVVILSLTVIGLSALWMVVTASHGTAMGNLELIPGLLAAFIAGCVGVGGLVLLVIGWLIK